MAPKTFTALWWKTENSILEDCIRKHHRHRQCHQCSIMLRLIHGNSVNISAWYLLSIWTLHPYPRVPFQCIVNEYTISCTLHKNKLKCLTSVEVEFDNKISILLRKRNSFNQNCMYLNEGYCNIFGVPKICSCTCLICLQNRKSKTECSTLLDAYPVTDAKLFGNLFGNRCEPCYYSVIYSAIGVNPAVNTV